MFLRTRQESRRAAWPSRLTKSHDQVGFDLEYGPDFDLAEFLFQILLLQLFSLE